MKIGFKFGDKLKRAIRERIMNEEGENEKQILTYRILYMKNPVQKTQKSHRNRSISWPEQKVFTSKFLLACSRVQVDFSSPFFIKMLMSWT